MESLMGSLGDSEMTQRVRPAAEEVNEISIWGFSLRHGGKTTLKPDRIGSIFKRYTLKRRKHGDKENISLPK